MRTLPPASNKLAVALWPTGRRSILGLLFADSSREWHLREIARRTVLSPAAAHAELRSLVEAGLLLRRLEHGRALYRANTACPIYPELHSIVLKTTGTVEVLRSSLEGLPGVDAAFIYGSLARGEETDRSDVDLLVIGDVTLRSLASRLRAAQDTLSRPVNPNVYPAEEFRAKLAAKHHFLARVMEEPKLFLVGDAHVLDRLAGLAVAEDAPAQPPGDRRAARRRRPRP